MTDTTTEAPASTEEIGDFVRDLAKALRQEQRNATVGREAGHAFTGAVQTWVSDYRDVDPCTVLGPQNEREQILVLHTILSALASVTLVGLSKTEGEGFPDNLKWLADTTVAVQIAKAKGGLTHEQALDSVLGPESAEAAAEAAL